MLLRFHALNFNVTGFGGVLVNPCFAAAVPELMVGGFTFVADDDIAITGWWTTMVHFGLVEPACYVFAAMFFDNFLNISIAFL